MSTAVVCAYLNLLRPSVSVAEAKSCSSCSVASSPAGLAFRPQQTHGGRSRYMSLACRASSGGSRRDNEKILARTQRRRSRHMKGVTPSTPDLLNTLDSEKQDQAKLDMNAINDDEDYYDEDEEEEYEDYLEDERLPLPDDEAAALSPEIARASYVGDKFDSQDSEDDRGLGDRAEETSRVFADVAGVDRDASTARRVQKSGNQAGDDLDDIREEGQKSARAVSDSAGDAADASGRRLQKAGRRVGDNLDEVRKAGQSAVGQSTDIVNAQAGRAVDNIQEGVREAGKAAQDVAGIAQENAEDAGKQLRKAGENITGDLQDVGKEGRKVLRKGGQAVSNQVKDALPNDLSRQVDKTQRNADRAVRTTMKKAQESANRVQDPIEKAVNASIDAAAAIGNEVFSFGDSIIEVVEEVTGMAGPEPSYRPQASEKKSDIDESEELVGGKYRPAGKSVVKRYQGIQEGDASQEENQDDQEEDGPFSGLTVLVAGSTGKTGRLIVEDLVGKGVKVRALARNVYRARNLKQLQGAELFEGDLYDYSSVKEALSGSNVVICAVGAQGLPFDLLQAYRTEYEGVLNLISAAKNQGDVKKFVLITTIGVNYLQVVPLLYWKRQAELFLQRSGLDYTIVRPAGLTGNRGGDRVELRPADSLFMGAVSRKKVADVCISAMVTPSASDKTVEVVGGSGRVKRSIADQFDSI